MTIQTARQPPVEHTFNGTTSHLDGSIAAIGDTKLDSLAPLIDDYALFLHHDSARCFLTGVFRRIEYWEGILRGNRKEGAIKSCRQINGVVADGIMDRNKEHARRE